MTEGHSISVVGSVVRRGRVRRLLGGRGRLADGRLLVTSQRTRDQGRNLEDARDKVRRLVEAARHEPRKRRATKPSAGAHDRRVRRKKETAERKRGRSRVAADDD